MRFGWPFLLWALLLVPFVLLVYLAFQRRRAAYGNRFAAPAMLPNVVRSSPGARRHLPLLLYLLAVTALVVGLARPYALMAVPRQRATVMLVMDSSNSMRAADFDPDRFTASRSAARAFMDQIPKGFEVGVVGFSRRPYILSRPTDDHVAVRRALGKLKLGPGTAVAEAMIMAHESALPPRAGDRAANRAGPARSRAGRGGLPLVFVLLTDGNDTKGGDPVGVARELKEAGVRVYSIALGDTGGESGGRRYRPPNLGELQRVAETTGGSFYDAPSAPRLRAIYRDIGTILATKQEPQEITAAFVGAGFILLLAGAGLSSLWFSRVA